MQTRSALDRASIVKARGEAERAAARPRHVAWDARQLPAPTMRVMPLMVHMSRAMIRRNQVPGEQAHGRASDEQDRRVPEQIDPTHSPWRRDEQLVV
eukprot:22493-Prymnesium_polylepis.1